MTNNLNDKIKISVVSYTNSLPFIYGLENTDFINKIDLKKDIPSVCARKIINLDANIGLIPVAALPKVSNYRIVSDYCIGANKKVDSVFLASNVELSKIENIILDYQSNTSNNLTKILAKKHWKISPNWINGDSEYISEIKNHTAGVVIGDRAFKIKSDFKYVYDLSEQWYNFTKLPFVFALWISNIKLSDEFISEFNSALKFGLDNIDKLKNTKAVLNNTEFIYYLTKSIEYTLDENKRKSIELYLKYLQELQ